MNICFAFDQLTFDLQSWHTHFEAQISCNRHQCFDKIVNFALLTLSVNHIPTIQWNAFVQMIFVEFVGPISFVIGSGTVE